MSPRFALSRVTLVFAAAWLLLVAVFAAWSVRTAIDQAASEVDDSGRILHRLMSQRVAQHDAHLTSLGALALAAQPPPTHELDLVATSIIRFYPRIASVDLVALPAEASVGTAPVLLISTRGPTGAAPDPGVIAAAGIGLATGGSLAVPNPALGGHYRIVKRLADTAGRLILSLDVDAARLVEAEERPPWARLSLRLGERPLVIEPPTVASPSALAALLPLPVFEKPLGSNNQPLVLRVERQLALSDVLSPGPLLTFAGASLAVVALAGLFLGQRRAAHLARQAAAEAQARERIREHEARLAHASRVNAMGEMASGIAHELTQPLTALLSQSQAGLRLATANPPDREVIAQVLAANVRQAKRAGDILARLRAYVSKTPPRPQLCDLNTLVSDIATLARIDLDRRRISLDLKLAEPAPQAWVDPVQIEQVVHNLIRNAADAIEHGPERGRRISVRSESGNGEARISVADDGPGVPPEIAARLFEPFFTTKPGGMGLGLSLCESLVERFGGRIEHANRQGGGAVFTMILPLATTAGQAEAAE